MTKIIGKTIREIIDGLSDYVFRDIKTDEECTIGSWNRAKGTIQVIYSDGRIEEYNDIVGPTRLLAIRLKKKEERSSEGRLVRKVQLRTIGVRAQTIQPLPTGRATKRVSMCGMYDNVEEEVPDNED